MRFCLKKKKRETLLKYNQHIRKQDCTMQHTNYLSNIKHHQNSSPHTGKIPKQATQTTVWFQIDFVSISTNQWVEIKACNYKLYIWLIRAGHAWSLSWMPHSLSSFLEEDSGSLFLFRLYMGQSPSYLICGLGARVSILGILTHLHEWAHSTGEEMEAYSTSRMESSHDVVMWLCWAWQQSDLFCWACWVRVGRTLQALCLP